MNTDKKFYPLQDDEVVTFEFEQDYRNTEEMFRLTRTMRCIEVTKTIKETIVNIWKHYHSSRRMLLIEGIQGKALRFGAKGWQKGKIRVKLTVEFCPDEPEVEEPPSNNQSEMTPPESPLDDLRRQLFNQANSPNNL